MRRQLVGRRREDRPAPRRAISARKIETRGKRGGKGGEEEREEGGGRRHLRGGVLEAPPAVGDAPGAPHVVGEVEGGADLAHHHVDARVEAAARHNGGVDLGRGEEGLLARPGAHPLAVDQTFALGTQRLAEDLRESRDND